VVDLVDTAGGSEDVIRTKTLYGLFFLPGNSAAQTITLNVSPTVGTSKVPTSGPVQAATIVALPLAAP